MKEITTYLMFDGQCREAMTFYAKCLGEEVFMQDFSQAPSEAPQDVRNAKDRIMHAKLGSGATTLMASDTMPGQQPLRTGDNFSVTIGCESNEEIERLFTAFSAGGTVTMPLQDMFWGARFGMLTDRFGINWMFNFDKPQ